MTPRSHHLTLLNHAGQRVGNPLTTNVPLGRCLLACPGFQGSRLHELGFWAANWYGVVRLERKQS